MAEKVVRVGVRELRDRLAHFLRLVQTGTLVEITERGRPVAQLASLPHGRIVTEKLVAEGRMTMPEIEIDWNMWQAMDGQPETPLPSATLADLRSAER